jgi:hypothetical protein
MECFLKGIGTILIVIVAIFLLGWRDSRRCLADDNDRRAYENSRSIEDRIGEIRQRAATDQVELSKLKCDFQQKYPDEEKTWLWIEQIIEYNRRLELLASSAKTSPQQVKDLADEASCYLKENRIKGILFVDSVDKLAQLIEERDSVANDNDWHQ